MTDRLYYTDPYLAAFDAVVVSVESSDAGVRIRLDRTAFYPTSGGQPFDTGMLADVRIGEVVDEDGDVVHLAAVDPEAAAAAGLAAGRTVHGAIDWDRRFDHMQQHTGQHVLSSALERLFRAATVSFHMGRETSTIDLQRELSAAEIAAAEDEANRVVWQDRPVTVSFVSPEDAARLPLRKDPAREGTLRLVDVQDFDLSACGGTHVAATGGIGMIAVVGRERFKGGQRLEFVCGRRALERLRTYRDVIAASVQQLSVLPGDIPRTVERLQAEVKAQGRTIEGLQAEQAVVRAAALSASAELTPGGRLVLQALDVPPAFLKATALAVAAAPQHAAVLVSPTSPAQVVVARAKDLPLSARSVLAALIARFGGRGGGSHELAQAGGLTGDAAAILDEARRIISG